MKEKNFKRNSRKRDTILEELRKLEDHPTAAELYAIVRKRIPNISLGTVYRNLDQMTQKGIIRKLDNGTEARFDGSTDKHYHISCTQCGRIDDVHELDYENKDIEMAKIINGYQVSGYSLNFLGVCPECVINNNNTATNI